MNGTNRSGGRGRAETFLIGLIIYLVWVFVFLILPQILFGIDG